MERENAAGNRILDQLTDDDWAELLPYLEPVELEFKETLLEQGKPIRHVYFPQSGVTSLVQVIEDSVIETGTIGREGFVGVPVLLAAETSPSNAFIQIPGHGLRMETERFLSLMRDVPRLQRLLLLYTNALMSMVAQTAACNRLHAVEARMARWLLMTRDRANGDEFPLTQEFLGQMLGVRRPAVNLAGRALQAAGCISYTRGRITIVDRAALQDVSCECYVNTIREMSNVRLSPDTPR